VPKLVIDPNNPVAQQMVLAQMTGAVTALFGRQDPKVVDAQLETQKTEPADVLPSSPPAGDGEGGGDSAPTPPSPDDAPPDLDEVDATTGEVNPDSPEAIKARLNAAWAEAKAMGIDAKAWKALVQTATGKDKYDGLTAFDLSNIERSLRARKANAS
jgi:hypothetical protein